MALAHQEQKHFLRDVFGNRLRAAHLQSEPVDTLPPAIQKRKRLLTPASIDRSSSLSPGSLFRFMSPNVNSTDMGIRSRSGKSSKMWAGNALGTE